MYRGEIIRTAVDALFKVGEEKVRQVEWGIQGCERGSRKWGGHSHGAVGRRWVASC